MKSYYGISIVLALLFIHDIGAQCERGRSATFARWSGVSPDKATPVFVYSASGEEDSLTGACLSRCRELEDCAAVVVMYSRGNCQGVAAIRDTQLKIDNDVAYFKKICLPVPEECSQRWWALENTPGYHLHADGPRSKVVYNTTVQECYEALLVPNREKLYRSAQWIGPDSNFNAELIQTSDTDTGSCVLHQEDKFTEPESYRVSNYYTFYMENQCRHDYQKKIDRCSYEEYYNQTLKHVEFTIKNYTKDECKRACETEVRFICRGFTWRAGRGRGACDLHSEDLVTTGSWLLRRTSLATYYRRVICLNMTVDCEASNLVVTYRPRGLFRGRVYVPGHGEKCGARAIDGVVKLTLPMHGDCDVNFAYGISNGPNGVINRYRPRGLFRGRVYVPGHGEKCGARAIDGVVKLTLPMHGDCDVNFAYGISNGPNGVINRTMAYVMVMIQNNPIIQTAGDRWVRVGCSPGAHSPTQVDATVSVRDTGKPSSNSEPSIASSPGGASAIYGASSAPLTMYIIRVGESEASLARVEAAGAVTLGEPLELIIETTEPTEIEPFHLVASSRLGDSSVLLLDSRGCSTGQVDFPPFTRSWLSGTQRLSSRFKAFRFPTSHVVRFALMVRFCENKCPRANCGNSQLRVARQTNNTYRHEETTPVVRSTEPRRGGTVVAQGGPTDCGGQGSGDSVPLLLEMLVDSKDILSTDTMIRADHRSTLPEARSDIEGTVVCVHELLLVALALAWLAVQVLLLLGCCILVKRYRNLAELSLQKDYHSFDNVGFETGSTHRRVHWPDQNIDIIHT